MHRNDDVAVPNGVAPGVTRWEIVEKKGEYDAQEVAMTDGDKCFRISVIADKSGHEGHESVSEIGAAFASGMPLIIPALPPCLLDLLVLSPSPVVFASVG